MFAIEELAGSFDRGLSGTIITTVVICGIVAQSILGNYTYFGASDASLDIINGGLLPLIVTAVIAGFLGGSFSLMLIRISALMRRVVTCNPIWIAGILGLAVAAIGWVSHGLTYGSGYEAAKDIITNGQGLAVSDDYGVLKMVATLLTYLSGIPGGIFAPTLSIGAGMGKDIALLFPNHFNDAIVLMAMVAYFSAVVQSPITAFVIVLEMTASASSNMVLPIMLASLIGNACSKIVCRQSLYHALAQRYLDEIKQKRTETYEESLRP